MFGLHSKQTQTWPGVNVDREQIDDCVCRGGGESLKKGGECKLHSQPYPFRSHHGKATALRDFL